MAVLLTAQQQQLCDGAEEGWGWECPECVCVLMCALVCVGKLALICFQAFLHLEWQPGAPRLI